MTMSCHTHVKVGVKVLWWENTEEALEVHYEITNDSAERNKDYWIDITFHVWFADGTVIDFFASNINLPREGESTSHTMFLPISSSEQENVIDVTFDWDLQSNETVAVIRSCAD